MIPFFYSCEGDGTCSENVESRVQIGFYTLSDDMERTAKISQFSMYGIQHPDSVLRGNNVSGFDFPLSMHATSSTLVMTADTMTDTLEVHYSSRLVLISWECGFTNQFEILSLNHTGNFIDSIAIVKALTDRSELENLKIFL